MSFSGIPDSASASSWSDIGLADSTPKYLGEGTVSLLDSGPQYPHNLRCLTTEWFKYTTWKMGKCARAREDKKEREGNGSEEGLPICQGCARYEEHCL